MWLRRGRRTAFGVFVSFRVLVSTTKLWKNVQRTHRRACHPACPAGESGFVGRQCNTNLVGIKLIANNISCANLLLLFSLSFFGAVALCFDGWPFAGWVGKSIDNDAGTHSFCQLMHSPSAAARIRSRIRWNNTFHDRDRVRVYNLHRCLQTLCGLHPPYASSFARLSCLFIHLFGAHSAAGTYPTQYTVHTHTSIMEIYSKFHILFFLHFVARSLAGYKRAWRTRHTCITTATTECRDGDGAQKRAALKFI